MNDQAIRDRLVNHGRQILNSEQRTEKFTDIPAADALICDLDSRPHAFVLACVMDRQIKAEKAWLIPYELAARDSKLAGFSMEALEKLSLAEVQSLMLNPKPVHRFVEIMSKVFYSAIRHIKEKYRGDASRIWRGRPSSAEVVYRFLEFDGVGPKIANMATNILVRGFKIQFADYASIDISADVHVRRVFARLGLSASNASVEQIIYKARALHPEFPGIMDSPCWEIGRNWCKAGEPDCASCYMKDLCPTANGTL
ncbi:MAG: iron-sulfur cluster loop [Verrucomicrobiae bacterium]|nr:iron-sulfur cluster loop [Verrucomicrobiae bacterium]